MKSLNRREFLGATATLAAAGVFVQAADGQKPIRIGLIGAGGYGMANVRAALKVGGARIVSICDVDSEHLARSAAEIEKMQGSKPATFKLYEDLIKAGDIDAAIIASPPQWHALQLIACVNAGLDVYCEKPLAYDIREGRAMVDAVRKSGRIVQIGFQRRQAGAIKAAREYIQAGNAGRIVQVEANIHYNAGVKDPNPKEPPASLDWDLWCGPGPKIPYSEQVGHVNWRLEKTSGHGHLVDWGIHLIDATRWILDETMPRTVAATGGIYYHDGKITTPDVLTAHFEFGKCPVTWRHRIWGAEEYAPEVSNGIFFFGDKETVFVTDARWVAIPRFKGKERKTFDAPADAGRLHMAEFLEAVRTRKDPGCPVEQGHQSTTTVKLAMIAYDTGRKIAWDQAKEEIINDAEASKLLLRDYRAPWQHPYKRQQAAAGADSAFCIA